MSDDAESELKALHAQGAFDRCLEVALRRYGPELEGWLFATAPRGLDPDEAWAAVCFALVQGLPRFAWRASFRTWMYQVARYTVRQGASTAARHQHSPLSQVSRPSKLQAPVSERPSFLGDAVEARLAALRATLDEEDTGLLYLRIDQNLSWPEVSAALGSPDDDGEAIARRTVALRKRFERLKARIRAELEG